MNYKNYLYELNGYIKALQKLCGSSFVFGVNEFGSQEAIERIKEKVIGRGDSFNGAEETKYSEVVDELKAFVTNGLLSNQVHSALTCEKLQQLVVEDINEYLGLISTSINKEGEFYPFKRNKLTKINLSSEKYEQSLFLLVPIESIQILFYFYKKK